MCISLWVNNTCVQAPRWEESVTSDSEPSDVSAGNKLRPSGKAAHVHNCWAFSPAFLSFQSVPVRLAIYHAFAISVFSGSWTRASCILVKNFTAKLYSTPLSLLRLLKATETCEAGAHAFCIMRWLGLCGKWDRQDVVVWGDILSEKLLLASQSCRTSRMWSLAEESGSPTVALGFYRPVPFPVCCLFADADTCDQPP